MQVLTILLLECAEHRVADEVVPKGRTERGVDHETGRHQFAQLVIEVCPAEADELCDQG